MAVEKVEALVVGGGQAGLAMSRHLRDVGVEHLVLERGRVAERWRSERWDSLVANGPAWHDRFPDMAFADTDPDAFPGKETVARYFEDYARRIDAPLRCGVEVREARRLDGRPGFRVETTAGAFEAANLVAATGPFQRPLVPALLPEDAGVQQIHSSAYRNPAQIAGDAVLVVGAGASGVQIADELLRAGKRVYLSVGPHSRPPRSYRGLDYVWWLGVLGKWDAVALQPGMEHVTISVSGADGGRTIDFRRLARDGMTLVGVTEAFEAGAMRFRPGLAETIAQGDANYLSVLDEADAYVARNGLDLPAEPDSRVFDPDPPCVSDPLLELDLAKAGVATIVWATGYAADFGWLKAGAYDEQGRPKHDRGVSREPGLYFLGLPWLARRASSFIYGVWHDARFLADHIATQRRYRDYRNGARADGGGR